MISIVSDRFRAVLVLLGIVLVGYTDYITGIEVRVFPLYFLPLVTAANLFGKRGAVVASILASLVWVAANLLGGRVYSHSYIWAINFVSQGAAFLVVSMLVFQLRGSLTRVQELSRTDSLTGLMNSRAFHDQAGAALTLCHRHKRPVTVAFMDLDNFKHVNDKAGHQTGNELLQVVAQTLSSGLRKSDFVARVGGDEFILLLPETNESQANTVLNNIREQFELMEAFRHYAFGVSVGAVVYSQAPPQLTEMIKEADELMYEVKAGGKNAMRIRLVSAAPGIA